MPQAGAVSPAGSPTRSCPFLQPLGWRAAGSVARETTCALSPAGLGPPSADELAWLCTDDHHYGCPRYRDGRHILTGVRCEGAPAAEAPR